MRAIPRWLPPVLVVVALAGLLAAFGSLFLDEARRDWYDGRLGGSTLYTLSVAFARVLPFLVGLGIAIALLQRERGKRSAEDRVVGESVVRHGRTEVVTHWVNAAGVGIALITGAWMLRWFGNPFSIEVTYGLHYLGAGLTMGAVAHHLTYHIVGGGFGLIPRSPRDVKDAVAELIGYLGVYRGLRGVLGVQLPRLMRQPIQRLLRATRLVPDAAGKYLATEKVISYPVWAALIGVLVVTGLIKSVHYMYPMPGAVRQVATFFHTGSAIFVVIFLAVHVGALVFVPRNWPLLKSMFTTRISRAYAERHLPEWRLEGDADEATAASAPAVRVPAESGD